MDSYLAKFVSKKIIYPAKVKKDSNYADGTQVSFHIKVESVDEDPYLYDDSRKWGKPIDLLMGKKFKLEILEACAGTMCEGEIAAFTIDKAILGSYPLVSKTLRDAHEKKKGHPPKQTHCCGMGFKEGLGYKDLDDYVAAPKDLKFTIEMIKVDSPGSFEKEFWAMNDKERLSSIHKLREEGNVLFKENKTDLAAKSYSEALGRLEQIMLKEKPGEDDWNELNDMKVPLLLNFAQCQHLNNEHYLVIEHCTSVLNIQPENVKALFRRGRAHVNVFNPTEARQDLEKVSVLDPSVTNSCRKLLSQLAKDQLEKDQKDRNIYKNLFT